MKNRKLLLLILSALLSSCSNPSEKIINDEQNTQDTNEKSEQESNNESSSDEKDDDSKDDEEENTLLELWESKPASKYTFGTLGEDEMPINGWVEPQSSLGCNTDEQYQLLQESGINTISGVFENPNANIDDVYKSLENASNHNINFLVNDMSLIAKSHNKENLGEYIGILKKYPGFAGFLACDEPIVSQYEQLRFCKDVVEEIDPTLAYYVNLLPTYGDGTLIGTTSYEDYVRKYIDIVNPKFLSFDYYGCRGEGTNVLLDYFTCLDTYRKLSLEKEIPFWSFACVTKHLDIRVSEAETKWQVNTQLAFGAKGMQYFCYQNPKVDEMFSDNGTSMVLCSGEKTDYYDYVQTINKRIKSMEHILMNSTNIGLMQYNKSPAVVSFDKIKSCRELERINTSSNILVGCFDYGGKSAFYVVNNSLNKTARFIPVFNQYVEGNLYGAEGISSFKGEITEPIVLTAGDAMLIELTNYQDKC